MESVHADPSNMRPQQLKDIGIENQAIVFLSNHMSDVLKQLRSFVRPRLDQIAYPKPDPSNERMGLTHLLTRLNDLENHAGVHMGTIDPGVILGQDDAHGYWKSKILRLFIDISDLIRLIKQLQYGNQLKLPPHSANSLDRAVVNVAGVLKHIREKISLQTNTSLELLAREDKPRMVPIS